MTGALALRAASGAADGCGRLSGFGESGRESGHVKSTRLTHSVLPQADFALVQQPA
jgi:hypothetical protein